MNFKFFTFIVMCIILDPIQCAEIETDDRFSPEHHFDQFLGSKEFPFLRDMLRGTPSLFKRNNSMNLKMDWLHLPIYIPSDNSCAFIGESNVCSECRILVGIVLTIHKIFFVEHFKQIIILACTRFDFGTESVCYGAFEHFYPILYNVVEKLTADNYTNDKIGTEICGISLQSSYCRFDRSGKWNWNIPIHGEVPECVNPKKTNARPSKPISVHHITDIHLQLNYTVGSNANCSESTCCRPNQNDSTVQDFVPAGKFGATTGKCDLPPILLHSMLHYISRNKLIFCPDWVIVTGDMDTYEFWSVTRESLFNVSAMTWQLINSTYAEKCPNIRIFMTFGNHDAFPLNQFPPPGYRNEDPLVSSDQANNDLAAAIWPRLAKDSTIASTIRKQGYYSTKLKDDLILVALNSNPCYTLNFWLSYKPDLIREQLVWLEQLLNQAEKDGSSVIMLSHIPHTDDSLDITCATVLDQIIQRYQNIITIIFNGHTHVQDINAHYAGKSTTCLAAMSINGGSVSPWNDGLAEMPNFSEYNIDSVSYELIGYQVYSCDILAANLQPDVGPQWRLTTSIPRDFGMRDCSLYEWNRFYQELPTNLTLVDTYLKTVVKYNPNVICDKQCKADLVAKIPQRVFCQNQFGKYQGNRYSWMAGW